MDTIDIRGLSKAEVLAALYNGASPQGMGFMRASNDHVMTTHEAREIVAHRLRFDYLAGRSFKIDLSGDKFDPRLYDRDNGGDGTAENIINRLRETGAVNSPEITKHREAITADHAFRSPNEAEFQELIGEAVKNFRQMASEVIGAGIPTPRVGMTARQHLNWAADEALKLYSADDYPKAVLMFAILTSMDERTAWIPSHPMTPALMQIGVRGGRAELERMMKGFAA